ncbi:MAG: hypothetical protein ACKVS5_01120 [Parvularculaceae bacterium]
MKLNSKSAAALTLAVFFASALGGAVVAAQSDAGARPDAAVETSAPSPAPDSVQPQLVDARVIDLGEAYPDNPAAAGRIFRARKIALAPGARTDELSAPEEAAIYYVTAGEIVEKRNDAAPVKRTLHAAGLVAAGMPLVIENASAAPAEILLVDLTAER